MLHRYGWTLFAHPLFSDQLHRLVVATERSRQADPQGFRGNANATLLRNLRDIVLDRVPQDPLATSFRQGNALGPEHRHWFRAKFGGNRFRLFFRADKASRIIVYAWVNDRDTLRKAGAASDPYAVFAAMLARGNPPDNWAALLKEAQSPAAVDRLATAHCDDA